MPDYTNQDYCWGGLTETCHVSPSTYLETNLKKYFYRSGHQHPSNSYVHHSIKNLSPPSQINLGIPTTQVPLKFHSLSFVPRGIIQLLTGRNMYLPVFTSNSYSRKQSIRKKGKGSQLKFRVYTANYLSTVFLGSFVNFVLLQQCYDVFLYFQHLNVHARGICNKYKCFYYQQRLK